MKGEIAPLRSTIEHYREALVKADHDPSTRDVQGKFHIYVTGSEREAVAKAGPYLHNYWTVAGTQNTVRATARQIQTEDQIARGNVIAGEPQRYIDIIRRWRDAARAHHRLRNLLLRRDASGDGVEEHPPLRR